MLMDSSKVVKKTSVYVPILDPQELSPLSPTKWNSVSVEHYDDHKGP